MANAFMQTSEPSQGEAGWFLELGTNRLARDLFLLTAVYALFVVMFLAAAFQIQARRTWASEAQVSQQTQPRADGLLLGAHLRKDGRIRLGEALCETPEQAGKTARRLLAAKPELRQAKVILNTWRETPSIRTSDVAAALAEAGLDRSRFYIRFTEE